MNGEPSHDTANVTVHRWVSIEGRERLIPALERIFFQSSATHSFDSEADRQAFLERWLGRYLACDPDWAYVALTADGDVAGYLAGCIEDPARTPRFSDVGYFAHFAELTDTYRAHLHVNIAPEFRNQGIGGQLIDAFVADAARAGVSGAHVVTGAQSRNVRFYERHGFHELARMKSTANEIVFLGRTL